MCLVLTLIFSYLSFIFFSEGDNINGAINGVIALGFIILLARNIIKTKKEKEKNAR